MTVRPYFLCLPPPCSEMSVGQRESSESVQEKAAAQSTSREREPDTPQKLLVLCFWPQGRMCPAKGSEETRSSFLQSAIGTWGFPVVQPQKNSLLRRKTLKQPIQPYNNTLSLLLPYNCISIYLSIKVKCIHVKLLQNIRFKSHSSQFPSLDKSFEYPGVITFSYARNFWSNVKKEK